ncbi:MAG: hypothetical protein EBT97_04280 [Actinobacteria bacterium]|nr:hypothetical protein [Actinomycetota bacterium]
MFDLLHKAVNGSLSSGNLRLLVRESALYNAMSQALDRLRDDGFTVEVRYHGTTGPRLPEIGNASATGMATDASLNVTVSWAD